MICTFVLMLISSISTAAQFVIKEKIMMCYHADPLVVVGLEGVFGLTTVLLLIPVVYSSEIRESMRSSMSSRDGTKLLATPRSLQRRFLWC
jgi:hypothetical protein